MEYNDKKMEKCNREPDLNFSDKFNSDRFSTYEKRSSVGYEPMNFNNVNYFSDVSHDTDTGLTGERFSKTMYEKPSARRIIEHLKDLLRESHN